jgi:hypothetical protein
MVVVDDYCANVRLNAENPTQMSDAYRTPLTFDYLLAAVVTLEMPYHSGVIVTRSAIASRGSRLASAFTGAPCGETFGFLILRPPSS